MSSQVNALTRRLSLSSVVAVSLGAMLGSGIFVLPGLAAQMTGPSIWLAYFLASLIVLPAAASKAELGTAMPTSGGTYVYMDRTFGPLAGTIMGVGLAIALLLKSSFALVGFGAYLSVFTNVPIQDAALVLLVVVMALNLLGIGKVSGFLIFTVGLSLTGLLLLSGWSLSALPSRPPQEFLSDGYFGLLSAVGFVFVSYAGVTKIAAIAEEIKSPDKNLHRGMFLSLGIAAAVYTLVAYVLTAVLEADALKNNLKPIYELASVVGNQQIGLVFAGLAVLTMMSMANAGLLAASRFPFAMSRDRLLPPFLGILHSRFLTPTWSILVSSCFMGAIIVTVDLDKIVKWASALTILAFTLVHISVIVLRESRVQWYKPEYKSFLYPWTQLAGIISGFAILFAMGSVVLVAVLAAVIPGVLIYFFYGRLRVDRKGVLGKRSARKDLVEKSDVTPQYSVMDFSEEASVAVALFGKERSPEMLVELAVALADGSRRLEVIHLTEVPEQTLLQDMNQENSQMQSLRRRIQVMSEKQQIPIQFNPIFTRDIYRTLHDATQRLHCRWLVVEWGGKTIGAVTLHKPLAWLGNRLSCNLVTFRDTGVRYIKKILAISSSCSKDRLVIDTADHLAGINNAEVTFVSVIDESSSEDEEQRSLNYLNDVSKLCKNDCIQEVIRSNNYVEHMVELSAQYDLVVQAGEKETLWTLLTGSEPDRITARATCSVVNVLPSR